MLSLAVFSLIFNLCFPQYTAQAYAQNQRFVQDENLKTDMIALNKEIDNQKNKKSEPVQTEIYAVLPVEKTIKTINKPKAAAKVVAKVNNSIEAVKTGTSTKADSKWVTVTAYSSTVDQCDSSPFITASGTHVRDGIIATNLLAFGTRVKFPSLYGDKIFVVEDRMNKRFGNRADIWFETREQAKQFGIKKLEMIIVS